MKTAEDGGEEEWGGMGRCVGKFLVGRVAQGAVEGAGAWFLTALPGMLVADAHVYAEQGLGLNTSLR